jgi:hypothetical protein
VIAQTCHINSFIDWPLSWAKQTVGFDYSNDYI